MLTCGSSVLVSGLVTRQELNGRFGVLEAYDVDKARWHVRLVGGAREGICVLPQNLCCADSLDGRAKFLGQRVLAQNKLLARVLGRLVDGDPGLALCIASFLPPRDALLVCSLSTTAQLWLYRHRARCWHVHDCMSPRKDYGACALPGGCVLIAGGDDENFDAETDCNVSPHSVELVDVLTGRSKPLASLNCARRGCAVAMCKSKVYVCGGGQAELMRTRARLSRALGLFQESPALLSAEDHELVENQLARPGLQSLDCASTIECLEVQAVRCEVGVAAPALARWESVAAPTHVALAHSLAVGCVGGKLIVAGGSDENGFGAECWSFDPLTERWDELPELPSPRAGCGFCEHPRLGLVLAGGCDAWGPLDSVVALPADTEAWQPVAPLSAPRIYCALAAVCGVLFAVGGSCDGVSMLTVERYLESDDRWEVVPDMGIPRGCRSCCAFGVTASPMD